MQQIVTVLSIECRAIFHYLAVVESAQCIYELLDREEIAIDSFKLHITVEYSELIAASDARESLDFRTKFSSLEAAPPHQSPDNIVNCLCDDLLREIFRHIPNTIGLLDIAKVCTRFNSVAFEVFRARTKGVLDIAKELRCGTPLSLAEDYFQTFGTMITSIRSNDCYDKSVVFALASENCPNVTKIEWTTFRERCTYSTLHLPPISLPNLIEITTSFDELTDSPSTKTFFQLNPQLEKLWMLNWRLSFGIDTILRYLPNLQLLALSSSTQNHQWSNVACFGKLRSLDTLLFDSFCVEHMKRILGALRDGNVELKRLKVVRTQSYDDYDGLTDFLCGYKSIAYLQVNHINDRHLLCMARSMPLIGFQTFSSRVTINGIRHALEQATHLKKATFYLGIPVGGVDMEDLKTINTLHETRGIELTVQLNDIGDRCEVNALSYQHRAFFLNELF